MFEAEFERVVQIDRLLRAQDYEALERLTAPPGRARK